MSIVSTHTHFETYMTASTIDTMVNKAVELKREYLTYTDYGLVSGLYKTYSLAKKKNIKLIPGCEIYLKDPKCPYSNGLGFKYFSVTVYAEDQASYQRLGEMLSKPSGTHVTEGEDEIPTFTWSDLSVLKNSNISFVLAGPNSVTSKLALSGRKAQAKKVVDILNKISKNKTYVAMVAAKEDKVWNKVVRVKFNNGQELDLSYKSQIELDIITKDGFKKVSTKSSELVEVNSIGKKVSAIYPSSVKINIKDGVIKSVFLDVKSTPIPGGCVIEKANKENLIIAKHENLKVLISDYAFMASETDKLVQDSRLEGQRLEASSLHMKTESEALLALKDQGFSEDQIMDFINNTKTWAKSFDSFKLEYKYQLPKITDDPEKLMHELISKTGRMKWDDKVWVDRLNYELKVFRENGVIDLLPYPLPIAAVFDEYKRQGRLVGPSRGSAGASLLNYVIGITHLDPLHYDLPFDRYFSQDRVNTGKYPDIDCDLPSRDILVGEDGSGGLLKEMFPNRYAQISIRGNIRLKSAIKDVNRSFNNGVVDRYIEELTLKLPTPPQGVSDKDYVFGYKDSDGNPVKGLLEYNKELKEYAEKKPKEWEIVSYMLGIPRQFGRHASAYVITQDNIDKTVPTMMVNGFGPVTQYEAKEVEAAGLIKYDFLVIRQLLDLEGCLNLINKKNKDNFEIGYFNHEGKKLYIWDLPQNDAKVKEMIKSLDFSTLFQVHTNSMRPYVSEIQPANVIDFATCLALVRPGPLDYVDPKTGRNMAQEYVERRYGRSKTDIPELLKVLPDTYASIVYQEDITKIAKEIAKMSGSRAEILRDNMCKKRKKVLGEMKPEFMAGAVTTVGEETADKIWQMMETFGQYGFSCFTEDQLVKTEKGTVALAEAYQSGIKIAYLDGDKIEYERPSHWFDQGKKEVFEIELEDGSLISCTSDHLFLNEEGNWVKARDFMQLGYFYAK